HPPFALYALDPVTSALAETSRNGAGCSAQFLLVCIQVLPAIPVGEVHATAFEQISDLLGRIRLSQLGEVFQQVGDGFQSVALGVTDQADWTTLDPAGGVQARNVRARSIKYAAFHVWQYTLGTVVFDVIDSRTEVAHGAVDGLQRVFDE